MTATLTPARVAADLVARVRAARAAGAPIAELLVEAAGLIAEYEAELIRVEPENAELVGSTMAAVHAAFAEYQRASEVAGRAQAQASSTVDSLTRALELLRGDGPRALGAA